MLRPVRAGITTLVLLAVLPAISFAGGISVLTSTAPRCITLVGLANGAADPVGTFSVTVRDLARIPSANVLVAVDFSGCPDIQIAAAPYQPASGSGLRPAQKWVVASTNSAGVATFDIVGAVNPATRGTSTSTACAKIYADGFLLGTPGTTPFGAVSVSVLDQDGTGGVGLGDLALLVSDFYLETYFGRSDYDCSGTVSMVDVSIWATSFYSRRSIQSAAAYAW